ncbi:hypothetical protein Pph01_80830 [Planotetraspora phitsanulokensis]|uniref:Uncharacterized protein n=1 Tax=Planotetraspora phitsanulokensis TaxID=575192 RepID=A0A8J3UR14_9ACTN|nr:hypothetical protein Pph01_80830 [Planotetraspora phitsanulokensis]
MPGGAQLGLQQRAQAPLMGADHVMRRMGRAGERESDVDEVRAAGSGARSYAVRQVGLMQFTAVVPDVLWSEDVAEIPPAEQTVLGDG